MCINFSFAVIMVCLRNLAEKRRQEREFQVNTTSMFSNCEC
jgi:hypothetical protein